MTKQKTERGRQTVGSLSLELSQKLPESRDPVELQREMTKDYIKNLLECVQKFRKTTMGDFYVVVLTRRERLMSNVIRNQFAGVFSCPTPNYDQGVYKYTAQDENITFLWQIPDRETCFMLKNNAHLVVPDERQLLQYVLDFDDGTLYSLCKKLNGESKDAPYLEKGL